MVAINTAEIAWVAYLISATKPHQSFLCHRRWRCGLSELNSYGMLVSFLEAPFAAAVKYSKYLMHSEEGSCIIQNHPFLKLYSAPTAYLSVS